MLEGGGAHVVLVCCKYIRFNLNSCGGHGDACHTSVREHTIYHAMAAV